MGDHKRKSSDSISSQTSLNTPGGKISTTNERDTINSSIVEQVEAAVIESITVRTRTKKMLSFKCNRGVQIHLHRNNTREAK